LVLSWVKDVKVDNIMSLKVAKIIKNCWHMVCIQILLLLAYGLYTNIVIAGKWLNAIKMHGEHNVKLRQVIACLKPVPSV
jgi:hypothetical protein